MKSETGADSFRQRLALLIGAEEPFAWAKRVGIPSATFDRMWNGGTVPKADTLRKIALASNVSLDWLLLDRTGTADVADVQAPRVAGEHPPPEADVVSIPRLNLKASAGRGLYASGAPGETMDFPRAILQRLQLNPKHAVVLQANGPSMEPTIGDGDWMIADVSDTHVADGRIYVLTIGDEAFVKRLFRVPGGGLVMRSDNRELFPNDQTIPPDEHITIFARVKWTERQL